MTSRWCSILRSGSLTESSPPEFHLLQACVIQHADRRMEHHRVRVAVFLKPASVSFCRPPPHPCPPAIPEEAVIWRHHAGKYKAHKRRGRSLFSGLAQQESGWRLRAIQTLKVRKAVCRAIRGSRTLGIESFPIHNSTRIRIKVMRMLAVSSQWESRRYRRRLIGRIHTPLRRIHIPAQKAHQGHHPSPESYPPASRRFWHPPVGW